MLAQCHTVMSYMLFQKNRSIVNVICNTCAFPLLRVTMSTENGQSYKKHCVIAKASESSKIKSARVSNQLVHGREHTHQLYVGVLKLCLLKVELVRK